MQTTHANAPHTPVLLQEMLEAVDPQDGETIVDGTFGAGGYSRALLEKAQCKVIALDRDPSVSQYVETLAQEFGERFTFIPGRFGAMHTLLAHQETIHAMVLDIGVSSMQLDQAERGFSFQKDAPLDMRMSGTGITAAELIQQSSQKELASLLWEFGEEKASRRIASAIVQVRQKRSITRTLELRDVIHGVVPPRGQPTDPATRTFQALRIAVNEELQELSHALYAAEQLLSEGGRLVVVTFHSLEDRIVKRFMAGAAKTRMDASRHHPATVTDTLPEPTFELLYRKGRRSGEAEISSNPRSRSATLRAARRTGAAARQEVGHA